jgi:hypothetical protein
VSNNNNTPLASPGQTVNVNITDITEEEILDAIKALDLKSTNGPDKIPSFFLKDFVQEFLLSLFYIFNLALKSDTFPDSWKIAIIIPVFKKGVRSAIENYRPVALLNNFSTIFELVLFNRLNCQIKNISNIIIIIRAASLAP